MRNLFRHPLVKPAVIGLLQMSARMKTHLAFGPATERS
jgi:hypothetical protein